MLFRQWRPRRLRPPDVSSSSDEPYHLKLSCSRETLPFKRRRRGKQKPLQKPRQPTNAFSSYQASQPIWEFPKIGDPDIVPQTAGSFFYGPQNKVPLISGNPPLLFRLQDPAPPKILTSPAHPSERNVRATWVKMLSKLWSLFGYPK